MNLFFEIIISPDDSALESLSRHRPDDPFCTAAYARAQKQLGFVPCILKLCASDGRLSQGCFGFFKKGRLGAEFDVPWLPAIPADSPFWPGLLAACKTMGVWDLSIRTFSTTPLPVLGAETAREHGLEYRLNLTGAGPLVPPSANHRRRIVKARKEGVIVRRVSTPDAIPAHLSLMNASMGRRAARGETVTERVNTRFFQAMLQHGAAEFAQAVKDDVVASSIFVMRSTKGAYYQTAGTSPEGMNSGTSPFLITELAGMLRQEGVICFDLGGSTPMHAGLSRFKAGFGGEEIPFEIATYSMAHPLLRKLRTIVRLLRYEPTSLLREFIHLDRYCVFSAAPGDLPPLPDDSRIRVMKLADDRLRELCREQPEFHRQMERLDEFGFNDAYGVFMDDELAHVSWLVTADHDRLMSEREVKLRDGEAEITHCFTAESFRGKGIYPLAIRALCAQAEVAGITCVFMATHPTNTASLRGIAKAGFKSAGQVFRLRLPFLSKDRVLRWRGHR
jgi:RimJ/RimL family protein N-acetyltransferase